MLLTLLVAVCLALPFAARGVVHAGLGTPDGRFRDVTLAISQPLLRYATSAHLTWPWDTIQVALGRKMQQSSPLLISSIPILPALPPKQKSHRHVLAPIQRHVLKRRPAPVLWRPTRRYPLRLLITGDSLTGYLGPELVNELAGTGVVQGMVDTHDGTGLTRPDFVDWSVVASQQVQSDNPGAVVVLMGGNDFQNMVLANGNVLIAGTPIWTAEYQRRVAVCMRVWLRRARRVYWLSIPPARDTGWADDDAHINRAIRRAARQTPGGEYLDVLGPVTAHGRYTDFVYVHGQPVLIRESDGVHLNLQGSTMVAQEVRRVIAREWRLR